MDNNYTVDDNTVASNPGNIKLDKWVWFRHNKVTVGLLTLSLIGSILATSFIDTMYSLVVVSSIAINIYYWINKEEYFLVGDSNGGIVIGNNPTLIAVNTNLTKGYGDFPVIKIIKCTLLENLSIGDRVPTVALYTASSNESLLHWIDFNPIPLSYATDDANAIKSAMQSYPSEQWEQLERYLLELKKPYKPGLYQINKEQSDWNEVSDDSLGVLSSLEFERRDGRINLMKTVSGVVIFIAILYGLKFFI